MDPKSEQKLDNETEKTLSTQERVLIQRKLIEEFCRINAMEDKEKRNVCAAEWISKYADNFDQLGGELMEGFRLALAEGEADKIKNALTEIQRRLEELDKIYG